MSKGKKAPAGSLGSLLDKLPGSESAKIEDQDVVTEEDLMLDIKSSVHSVEGTFSFKSVRSTDLNTQMEYQEDSTALEVNFLRQASLFHDADTVRNVELGENKRFQMGLLPQDKSDLFCTSQYSSIKHQGVPTNY